MTDRDMKESISKALKSFGADNFTQSAISLFQMLGYDTSRQSPFATKKFEEFEELFLGGNTTFNRDKALVKDWETVDLLFQLSQEELVKQHSLFETKRVDQTVIETYLFFAIELADNSYSRTHLSQITREINRIFPMPVMVLFKIGNALTLSVINRRLHKKDEQKDVLEKVTLIKDISIEDPHPAHILILCDLHFLELLSKYKFSNFVELHNAWQKTLDTKLLNNRFYKDLSNWYFWALQNVSFPADVLEDESVRNATNLIRLITRVIFVWFIKEKGLVSDALFQQSELHRLLSGFNQSKSSDSYYRAILQNLFFGTLNQKMEERGFVKDGTSLENRSHYGVKNLYRYKNDFAVNEDEILNLFNATPFLNGGLFDCLDKEDDEGKVKYIDGFSRNGKKQAVVPDFLFFAGEQDIDLNEIYGTKGKPYKAKGLVNILSEYKFTITENTPIEEEVALDPELLGKVFENLLASYNPETQSTARKQTGSFYTPREIVNYMVDESLKAYLKQKIIDAGDMNEEQADIALGFLFEYNEKEHLFNPQQVKTLIDAIDSCKILDPACGSGAFPMGVLHKLVHVLHKIDPNNKQWKERQIQNARKFDDATFRDNAIADIEAAFANNELDYGRKLFLIENCIYGVDIQPIAVQIAKLRFFISLVVDQPKQPDKDNFGIRSLPNLETKFVAANTLLTLHKPQGVLRDIDLNSLEDELKDLRHQYFSAKTRKDKMSYQSKDKELRRQIAEILISDGWESSAAKHVAKFDPYDQNASSSFFDPEWMFGLKPEQPQQGVFDVVFGNPPYVSANNMPIHERRLISANMNYKTLKGKWDLYVAFIERSLSILAHNGTFTFIVPFGLLNQPFAEEIRKLILKDYSLLSIVDLHNNKIFENATVPSCIPVIKKCESLNHKVSIVEFTESSFLLKYHLDVQKYHLTSQNMFRTEDLNSKSSLLEKIKTIGLPLADEFYVSTGAEIHGKESRDDNGSLISGRSKFSVLHNDYADGLKPYIEGSAIRKAKDGRYSSPKISLWLDASRPDQMRSPKFVELFESKKIIVRRSSGLLRILAVYDENKIYTSEKCILIISRKDLPKSKGRRTDVQLELKYLLAIINSTLMDFYYESVFGGFIDIYPNNLKDLPIVASPPEERRILITVVDYIICLRQASKNAELLVNLIDAIIYEMYLPEVIKAADCEVLKHLTNLPEIQDDLSDDKKLHIIEGVYHTLSDPNHPASIAMSKMQNIEEVRVIEGR